MRKSIVIISLLLCLTYINAQDQSLAQPNKVINNETIVSSESNTENDFTDNNELLDNIDGVSEEELNGFKKRDDPEDWIISWNVIEEDFNTCMRDSQACCYNTGSILPSMMQVGDKNAIVFTGPASGLTCPQDGLNNDKDLNQFGQKTSGILQFTNNIKDSNTEQTPEQSSILIMENKNSDNSIQTQNSEQQNIENQFEEISTLIKKAYSLAILLPAHANENTKETSLNILRLIRTEPKQNQSFIESQDQDTQTSPTSSQVLSVYILAIVALVISI